MGPSLEFIRAVKSALDRAGSSQNHLAIANKLWNSNHISFRKPYAQDVTLNDNPHFHGAAIECIESTVSRMTDK